MMMEGGTKMSVEHTKMSEAESLLNNTLEVARNTLDSLDKQESTLMGAQQELTQTGNEFQASYAHLCTKASWAAWIWSTVNDSTLLTGARNQRELLPVEDHEEGSETTNMITDDNSLGYDVRPIDETNSSQVEDAILAKVDEVRALGEKMHEKLCKSNDDITELRSSVDYVEEHMELLYTRVADMSTLSPSLENRGLFRLKVKDPYTMEASSACYLGCRVRGKILHCVRPDSGSSDRSIELFAFYRCGDLPLGGLMHLASGKWVGLDLFGRPVVQASRWAGWEALVLTKGGLFFPSRNFGTGAWLCWAQDAKGFDSFHVGANGTRVEIELEKSTMRT